MGEEWCRRKRSQIAGRGVEWRERERNKVAGEGIGFRRRGVAQTLERYREWRREPWGWTDVRVMKPLSTHPSRI